MVGDTPSADGASVQVGIPFAFVESKPPLERPDALLAAVGYSTNP